MSSSCQCLSFKLKTKPREKYIYLYIENVFIWKFLTYCAVKPLMIQKSYCWTCNDDYWLEKKKNKSIKVTKWTKKKQQNMLQECVITLENRKIEYNVFLLYFVGIKSALCTYISTVSNYIVTIRFYNMNHTCNFMM